MKKVYQLTLFLAVAVSFTAAAQWTTNTSTGDAYNNNSSGKVGIGTNTPGYTLEVRGPQNGFGACFANDLASVTSPYPAQASVWGIGINSEARIGFGTMQSSGAWAHTGMIKTIVPADGGGTLVFQTRQPNYNSLAEQMRITNNGNVGIGTPAPSQKLSVLGNESVSGDVLVGTDGGGISTISGPASSGAIQIKTHSGLGGAANRYLRFGWKDNNSVFTPVLSVNDDMNMGIGTTTPADQLEIVGGIDGKRKVGFNTRISDGGSGFIANGGVISLSRPDDGMKTMYIGPTAAPADDNVIFSQGGGTELRFVSNGGPYATAGFGFYNNILAKDAFGSARPTPVMRIDGNGNVGIGTGVATLDAKLDVKGQVHANEVKVDLTVPGPDYVFEKEYKLTSLEEIKNYIDQNKHLPEVPSAKEMEKNGVQLGEMNMLLLKKIEELTLHTIEMNKKVGELMNENKELKSRIETIENKK